MSAPNIPVLDPNAPAVPVFDPAAFEAKIMSGINTTLNGFASSLKKDVAKLLEKPPEPIVDPNAPNPDAPPAVESKTIADLNLRLQQNEKMQKAIAEELATAKKETEQAKTQALEEKRVAAFQAAIADIPFVSAKERKLFTDAYIGRVKYSEDGSLIVETEKGPVSHDMFLQAEAENMPNLLAKEGHGGAGATAGRKVGAGMKSDYSKMTTAELIKVPIAERLSSLGEAINFTMGNR